MMTIAVLDPLSLAPTPDVGTFPLIRADFSAEATVTEHPVELGGSVSDHVQRRPLRISTEIYVTSSPLGAPAPFAVEDAVGFFERALGFPCTLHIDGEGSFSPMVLEAAPHSRTVVGGRPFSLRWKYVRVAASLSVPIPPRTPAPVAAVGAPTEQPLGQSATTPGSVPTSTLFDVGSSAIEIVQLFTGGG